VLKHCHGRIRKQLATLEKLLAHLPEHGADEQARQAAGAVLKYFEKAAHLHHEDEEQDLIPMLRAVAQGEDAATLQALAPVILQDHKDMDAMWQDLHEQLTAIADGSGSPAVELKRAALRAALPRTWSARKARWRRWRCACFSPEQMTQLGQAMQRRRGIGGRSRRGTPQAPAVGDAVAGLRKDYGQASLDESEVADDPMQQFTRWFEEALKAEVNEPNAMGVATVDERGRPSSRIVLVKQFDERGFTWYTNYDSQKGSGNCAAILLQLCYSFGVNLNGRCGSKAGSSAPLPKKATSISTAGPEEPAVGDRVPPERADRHTARPSNTTTRKSRDSVGDAPQRPQHWGGFRLVPERIEFWQGRRSRFHDRIVYTRQEDGSWTRQRLQP
jgi:pyridoxamine 5'-phosphate oxidase